MKTQTLRGHAKVSSVFYTKETVGRELKIPEGANEATRMEHAKRFEPIPPDVSLKIALCGMGE